ncbi:bifunctional diguanylate cyclase/phosphodiesterase [Sulfurospirillum arcachonense]|uniref:EAL domain-containing protein n=1 Tax=Sulfurospirillum arcachonense TaxID=57666 RepID=UPI00046ACCFC
MWSKLSIKTQLIVFMTFLVIVIEVGTLIVIQNMYKSERQEFAIAQAQTLSKSLNNDLLKAILSPNVDMLSDITFRLSAFKVLNGLILYDSNSKPIFKYKKIDMIKKYTDTLQNKNAYFSDKNLVLKSKITSEDYDFGFTIVDIDMQEHKDKQTENLKILFLILPVALMFSFFISLFLSKNYIKPFSQLLNAFKKSNPTKNKIIFLKTEAQNEIKELYTAFNNSMKEISSSSIKLQYQADHDQLTGLYNRFYIENRLMQSLKDETKSSNILILISLDELEFIQNSVGNQALDELLKIFSNEISNTFSQNAIIAKIEGPNFAILLEDSKTSDILELIKQKQNEFSDFRFSWEGEAISVSAVVGLIEFKPFEYTLKELIKAINTTTHLSKSIGANRLHIYNPNDDISQRFEQEIKVANFIKEALHKGPSQFELYAQAIVPLQIQTDKISYEILIRMWDSQKNFVSPIDFLPTAERYQLMAEIDIHVLTKYLQIVTKYPEHIKNLHSVHINLAGSTLNNPDFQKNLKESILKYNFPWHKLELELTETSAVGNFLEAKEFISWLKNIGIGLALDDFGTGMSSFEYLKNLPFDVVKIDGSFVKDMHIDPTDKAVIKYIQEIASLKNQETVAEYVETQEDVDELTKIGITYGQGYFLGKPKPLSDWLNI